VASAIDLQHNACTSSFHTVVSVGVLHAALYFWEVVFSSQVHVKLTRSAWVLCNGSLAGGPKCQRQVLESAWCVNMMCFTTRFKSCLGMCLETCASVHMLWDTCFGTHASLSLHWGNRALGHVQGHVHSHHVSEWHAASSGRTCLKSQNGD
jgi:hypothetical protein